MHLQAGINAVSERNLFWDLSDVFATTVNYDPNKNWVEYYVKPGISFTDEVDGVTGYGRTSLVASYTQNTDAYDFGDTGRITLEEAYIGGRMCIRMPIELDVSIGPRELNLGTGMLIANGGSSGFERGALKFGPRKAWEMAAIGHIRNDDVTGTTFFIDPNEIPSTDNANRLAGADLRFDAAAGGFAGATYIRVLDSGNAYPQVLPGDGGAPTIVAGAREGLNAINVYGRTNPLSAEHGTFFLAWTRRWSGMTPSICLPGVDAFRQVISGRKPLGRHP